MSTSRVYVVVAMVYSLNCHKLFPTCVRVRLVVVTPQFQMTIMLRCYDCDIIALNVSYSPSQQRGGKLRQHASVILYMSLTSPPHLAQVRAAPDGWVSKADVK